MSICGPTTATITSVSTLVCNKLVKINNIQPIFPDRADLVVDGMLMSAYASGSASIIGNEIWTLYLLSKNVAAGEVTISFTVSQDPCVVPCPDQCVGSDLYEYNCVPEYSPDLLPTGRRCVQGVLKQSTSPTCITGLSPTHYISLSVGFVSPQVIDYFVEYIREISDKLMINLPLLPNPWVYLETTYDRAAGAFNIWLYLPPESPTLSFLSPSFLDNLMNWLDLYLPLILGVISIIIGALLIAVAPPAGVLYLIWGWTTLMAGAALLAYKIYDLAQQVTVMQNTVDNQQIQLTNLENKNKSDAIIGDAWQKSLKTQSDCTTRLMGTAGSQANFIQNYLDKYAKYVGLVTDLTAEKNTFTTETNSIITEFKGKPYSESTCNDYYGRIMTESGASETRTQDIINKYVIKEEKYSVACRGWTNQAACEKGGCFWFDSACHQEEACWISNPLGGCVLSARTGRAVVGATAAIFVTAFAYWLFTRKEKEVISIYGGAKEVVTGEVGRAKAAYRQITAPAAPRITGAPVAI